MAKLYYCDLCRTGGDRPLLGLHWQSTACGDVLVAKPFREVEHHICLECLVALHKIQLPPDSASGEVSK